MKIAFLLDSHRISGGTYVIFEHATRILDMNNDVYIITKDIVNKDELKWFPKSKKLNWTTYSEAKEIKFDVAVATWCMSVYELYKVNSKKYAYFVQSIESKFFSKYNFVAKYLVEKTYNLPLNYITEATWIKRYLNEKNEREIHLVKNGIMKDVFISDGESISSRKSDKLRVLVEGPLNVPFKNVERTIELCKESIADEIWLMTSSDIQSYPGVDRVFSRVPISETAKIYRSCDIIVKLSYVEGMFGPPLEMFHCGGSAITYDVTGHDEYIINNYNAIVVKTDRESEVTDTINMLKNNPEYLNELKNNALLTASKWHSWEEASSKFYEALIKICNNHDKYSSNDLLKFYKKNKLIIKSHDMYNRIKSYIKIKNKGES